MPDITMCMNNTCAKRNDCFRFFAFPNPHNQAYQFFMPEENGECEFYIESIRKQKETEQ